MTPRSNISKLTPEPEGLGLRTTGVTIPVLVMVGAVGLPEISKGVYLGVVLQYRTPVSFTTSAGAISFPSGIRPLADLTGSKVLGASATVAAFIGPNPGVTAVTVTDDESKGTGVASLPHVVEQSDRPPGWPLVDPEEVPPTTPGGATEGLAPDRVLTPADDQLGVSHPCSSIPTRYSLLKPYDIMLWSNSWKS